MKKALVTGAAGFIGSHLVRSLLYDLNINVVALDDLSGGFRDNLPSDVEFVQGSVTNHELLRVLFNKHNFHYVYHLAAYAAEGLSHFIRNFNYYNNLIGSVNLINEAVNHGVKCFVFTSSIAVYGVGQTPMREDMIPRPEDPYGIAKYAIELDLHTAHKMFGLNYVIFRPHNVYGAFQNIGDKYRNVVGIFMNQILQGQPMTIFGDGTQQRAFSYVVDIIEPIAKSAWMPAAQQRIFNIGADMPYTVMDLAHEVSRAMGVRDYPIELLPERNEVKVAYSRHDAAIEVFGPLKNTRLEAGLAHMAEWVRKVGPRASKAFSNIEIEKNLPPSWANTTRLLGG